MTPRPLRVLFVTHAFPRHTGDAAGSFVHALAGALSAREVEVHALAPAAPDLAVRDTLEGIPVRRFRYAPSSWETLAYTGTMAEQVSESLRGKAALALLIWRGRRAVRRAVRELRPDLIHAHWWFPSALISGGLGVPLLVTMHGSDVRLARTGFSRSLFRWVASRSTALCAVSAWLARQASEALDGRVVQTAPMPADTRLFRPPPPEERDSRRMLFVGRLNTQKGLDDLLHAMAHARRRWLLDVVGDGPDREALKRQARELGFSDRINWLGHLPQTALPELYGRCAALVMPSTEEGLGLVGVEAALCETPVVGYASGGLLDVVRDGSTGWLVPGGDVAALAHAIDEVLDRPTVARARGAAARLRALATFSPEAAGARYRAAYDAVLEGGP